MVGPPPGIQYSEDIEIRKARNPFRARVRWVDPATKRRRSKSDMFATEDEARAWLDTIRKLTRSGIDPVAATQPLAEFGETVMPLALRGLEGKTLDPYMAGWRKRVVPSLGHLTVAMITYGAVDRAVHHWIADGCGRSTVKNSIAVLVRVLEQAVRDGLIDRNPARITGWQAEFKRAEDELDNPRALALPSWDALTELPARSSPGLPISSQGGATS